MVEGNGDLHILVLCKAIAVAQEHDLVMVCHVIVRNSDGRRTMNGINQSITAVGQRAMVHPNMASSEDGNSVAVRQSPPAVMGGGVSHVGIPTSLAIVDVNTMNYNVGNILYGNAGSTSNVHICSSPINGFKRIHHELLFELDDHVTLEDDPQWLVLDDTIS